MENFKTKCSSKEDENINAISYCGECKIYMCNKCEKLHTKLFLNHQIYNIEKYEGEIFTEFCKEPEHREKLKFFCKSCNVLCCAACICRIKSNGIGQHQNCEVCLVDDIKEEKANKLDENIKYLEEISNTFKESIDNLKEKFDKIIDNKEELKMEVQKIFTKIRNELNNREDEILNEIDKKFDELYCDEKIFKDKNKLMNKIKFSLENGKKIKFNNEKLLSFVNDCINIENNIKDINSYNENIKKLKNSTDIKIIFDYGSKEQFNSFIENLKNFGNIYADSYFDSLILNEKNDFNKKRAIINWIKQKTQKNQMKFEKIFVMSQNGSSSNDFHNYCDNKGPTLTIIKTNKNRIFEVLHL